MSLLAYALNFDSPIVLIAGMLSLWIVVFFPFAIIARRMARPDAFHPIEAYVLGQAAGPLGVWLVKRGNDKAVLTALRRAAEIDEARRIERESAEKGPQRHTGTIPRPDEMPGGLAFKPPPKTPVKKTGPVAMDTWKPE